MIKTISTRLRPFLKQTLNRLNRTIVKTNAKADVVELIRKFWPMETGIELVRVGSEFDGGYLIPNDFEGIGGLFSPGVAEDASFERHFADLGIECFLADGSVSNAPISHEKINFIGKYLGLKNDAMNTSLEAWIEENSDSSELILQMDIEGSEFEVLLSTSTETLKRFRIIVVEFHGIDRIITEDGFLVLNTLLSKLENDFVVSHCHPNNNCGIVFWENLKIPRVVEVTFIRRDRVRTINYATEFPHALDRPNIQELPEIILPEEWFSPLPRI